VTAAWPVAAQRLTQARELHQPALRAPQAVGGWRALEGREAALAPRFVNTRAAISQTYVKDDRNAGIFIGYYRNQRPGAQLISSQNELASSEGREWKTLAETRDRVVIDGKEIPVIATRLRGPSTDLLAWRWYWVDGRFVVNPYWAKLLQARAMLAGNGDDAAVVVVVARHAGEPHMAEETLRAFVGAMLPEITTSLENARRSRTAS
jgi:EpsI family protein